MNEQIFARLAPYIPEVLLQRLPYESPDGFPKTETVRGAVLLLDIADFTPTVVALSAAGPRGIDALQRLLSSYYTEMIDVIHRFGGTVYQFAGDSLLTCFELERGEGNADVALRAVSCALELQARLDRFSRIELVGRTFKVAARVGVGFGNCHRLLLGDPSLWIHPVLVGPPLEAAVAAEKRAAAGEVLLSRETWSLVAPGAVVEERVDGFFKLCALEERCLEREPEDQSRPRVFGGELVQRASRLTHPVLFKKITTGYQDFIGDFREITCLFIRFEGPSYGDGVAGNFRELNRFYEFVQRESDHHGGVLIQTDFTDKGNVLFVLFGAPTAQENKELLATRLAAKLVAELPRFSFITNLQVGIATGPAYCGNLGSPTRKGYTTLGEVVNLAARLMAHRREAGTYVDANTRRKLRQSFVTEMVESAQLKGMDKPIPIYRVQSEVRQLRSLFVESRGELIGRRGELQALRDAVQRSFDRGGEVIVVSGEAGIGKSRLAGKLLEEAQTYGAKSLYGICYSYEMFTPFFPWKELLVHFFQIFETDDRETQRAKLQEELEGIEDAGPEWIPMLAGIMGLPIVDDPRLAGLDARRKQQKTFQIIFQLLRKRAQATPLLILFEDLHWADKISVDLLEYVVARMGDLPLMILVTTRPGEQAKGLTRLGNSHLIELSQLDREDTRELLRTKLGLHPPNLDLEDLILAKVHGNPFYIESIVHGLIEQGYLGPSREGPVVLRRSLQEISIPDSIQDVVLARIDRLQETEKTVVKVASVIGRIFTLDAVHALLAETISLEELRRAIRTLNDLGLTLLEVEEPLSCLFKHIVIRDVAYNTMLVSSREDLHRRLAGYLEQKAADNPMKLAGILAYHFLAGNDEVKGLHYTLLAAHGAKEQYANKDAIYHFNRAIELLGKPGLLGDGERLARLRRAKQELAETLLQAGNYAGAKELFEQCLGYEATSLERAEIHVGLGRVYQEKGETKPAIQEIERSLRLLGRRTPRNLVSLAGGILAQLAIGLMRVVLPWLRRPLKGPRMSLYRRQLSTLISLIKIYYFADIKKLTWATLVAKNMAERSQAETSQSLASVYYGTLLFGAGLLKSSGRHCRRGLDLARNSRDSMVEALALSRLGTHAIFCNELAQALQYGQQATSIFRQVGEMWELQTSLMMLATTHFLRSEFEVAERVYVEMGAIGRELHALMHQGWSHSWAPFCRYLLGREDARTVLQELERGHDISLEVNDLANQCAALNHMANVAVREQDPEQAAQVAVRAFGSIWRYHVLVPFLQIGLVDVAEAALFALEEGATSVPRAKLLGIARRACFKAKVIGKLYPYLRGPALRVNARLLRLRRGVREAEPVFLQAIAHLEQSPNRWEAGVACLDAAVALPHRREELLARAHDLFAGLGAKVELRRVQRLLGTEPVPHRQAG